MSKNGIVHGTSSGYRSGCKCKKCKQYNADRHYWWAHFSLAPIRHGYTGYQRGCKCEVCKAAKSEKLKEYYLRARRAKPTKSSLATS